MWSEYSLDVVDAVARTGSFSAAAQELHRVPSAVSYTVRQLEDWLEVFTGRFFYSRIFLLTNIFDNKVFNNK